MTAGGTCAARGAGCAPRQGQPLSPPMSEFGLLLLLLAAAATGASKLLLLWLLASAIGAA